MNQLKFMQPVPAQASDIEKKQIRKLLLVKRKKLFDRNNLDRELSENLKRWLKTLTAPLRIAVYWPIQGEFDILTSIYPLLRPGQELLLPIVQGAEQPLVFAPWIPTCPMEVGAYGIPIPATHRRALPDVILLPCVGFGRALDKNGKLRWYRLGYGGGFYDRTLAELRQSGWLGLAFGITYSALSIDLKTGWKPSQYDEYLDGVLTD
jgi:5-formyltetrahydrofolate cyclo-ligase